MENPKLRILLDRFFSNTCSPLEKAELMDLLATDEHDEAFKKYLDKAWGNTSATHQLTDLQSTKILSAIFSKERARVVPLSPAPRYKKLFWAAAAVLLLGISSTIYLLLSPSPLEDNEVAGRHVATPAKNDIAPGSMGAVLTLADGSVIVLDSAGDGNLATQGNTNILKTGGAVRYVAQAGEKSAVTAYNTIGTPRGRKFQLVLEDGTRVWLNAESSIRFPTVFEKNKRQVEITGEAYFEVAKNATKPFTVSVRGMEVQVLGTHFNVNAYQDETAINTTLLEGSVKVVNNNNVQMLVPGQQAHLENSGALGVRQSVNTREIVAWKDDLFSFNNTDIKTLMRQLSRWYDADIVMPRDIPPVTFTGNISRNSNLSAVLKILELTEEVSFTIEGKKVIVKM
jgi:ferric-dicitrate binding protein FerR (iron transport regulator)